ncbi:MAG TPA: hypothetical protein VIK69_11710 [Methylophilaceae bacterium]
MHYLIKGNSWIESQGADIDLPMTVSYRRLSIADIDDILFLETIAWPHGLRASAATIRQRLAIQHIMLGAFQHDALIGIAAWRYDMFDPGLHHPYPKDFDAFANRPSYPGSNAAYVYNFALAPAIRKTKKGADIGLSLIASGIDILIADGCKYLVGASRCPSYAGDDDGVAQNRSITPLRAAIDNLTSGATTSNDLDIPWQEDPVLSFYKHALNCRFTAVLPAFMAEDRASGGYAIGFYKALQ